MCYKNAMAGLDHGGGKAVIIGDPTADKTPELLRAYGRFVASLGGRYVTACDVGTYVADMDVVATENPLDHRPLPGARRRRRLLGADRLRRLPGHAGQRRAPVGRADAARAAGSASRASARSATTWWSTCWRTARGSWSPTCARTPSAAVQARHPEVEVAADTDALIRADLDVYAPCALGGALDDETVPVLTASVVCGAANNQLAHPGVEKDLADRGILYAPDYVVNAGGVIQVADELHGFDFERAKAKAAKIFDTTLAIFARASRTASRRPPPPTGSPSSGWPTAHPPRTGSARHAGDPGDPYHAPTASCWREEGKIAVDQPGQGLQRSLTRRASCGRRTVRARKQVPLKPYGPVFAREDRS